MKKLLFVFAAIVFASCASDDGSPSTTAVLLKKIVQTDESGNTYTATYHYNGNKLSHIMMDDQKIVYSYSGGKISSISFQNMAGVESMDIDLAYDSSGRLIHRSSFLVGPDIENYSDFTHNADGTVSVVDHYWNQFEGQYETENQTLIFNGNDLASIVTLLPSGNSTVSFVYDGSKNPYRNIAGFDKLLTYDASEHNTSSITNTTSDGTVLNQTLFSFETNTSGYPETSVRSENGSQMVTQYFYD